MKLVRSDSPEVADSIASARTVVNRYLPILHLGLLPNLGIVALTLIGLIFSGRAAVWVGVPMFFAWNAWVIWRARSPRLSWVIKTHADRIFIRLWAGFGKAWREVDEPDVMVLEASEIASVSIRSVEVFIYGPKPKIVQWLMIEPIQAVARSVSARIPSFFTEAEIRHLGERVYWVNDDRHLAVGWQMCQPNVRIFLQQFAQGHPSIIIGTEECSELDLNGMWNSRTKPNTEQQKMLVQAIRLGFGCECVQRVGRYKHMSSREAAAYLARIGREGAGPVEDQVKQNVF